MIARIRRKLRDIRYHSARRPRTRWTALREMVLVLSLPAAVAMLFVGESLFSRSASLHSASGALFGQPDPAAFAAIIDQHDDRTERWRRRWWADFTVAIREERRGWPIPSHTHRPPAQVDLNVLSEEGTRGFVVLPAAAPEREAIEQALARAGPRVLHDAFNRGYVERVRIWHGTILAVMTWWVVLTFTGTALVGIAQLASVRRGSRRSGIKQTRVARGLCHACGYDLRGLEFHDRCPECGTLVR
jgi:hypothetical protein